MILIAESGSTKTEWNVIKNGQTVDKAFTDGINPVLQNSKAIGQTIAEQLPPFFLGNRYTHIYFYGAGCMSDATKDSVRQALISQFQSEASIESDLMAAARSLYQHSQGIACILGTGSNSCFYDGNNIVKNVKPLGYILGDEGGGAVLGKMFVADYLKGLMPEALAEEFFESHRLSYEEIIHRIYREPFANRFFAGFSPFIHRHIQNQYVYNLVYKNFEQFFSRCLLQYDINNYTIGLVGSVAFYYADILNEVSRSFNAQITQIKQSPMEGLLNYHSQTSYQ